MLNQNFKKTIRSGTSFHEFKRNSDVANFPNTFSDYIQSYGDIYFWDKGNVHVVTKAEHAKQVLMSADYSADRGSFFISRMPNMDLNLIKDFFGVVKKMMVMSDDEDHTRRRKAAAMGFEDQILNRFKSTMTMTVKRLVQQVKGREQFEFVNSISRHLPSTVLADLFSIPECDREKFLDWSNIMTGFFGGASQYQNEDGILVNSAALSLKNYFTELVKERKKNIGDDYVSIMLQSQNILKLDDDELISQLIMMLVAGMATTTDQINNAMYLYASNVKMQNEVRSNVNLVNQMLEEAMRFDPAVTFIFRVARAQTNIGDQLVLPGEVVFISSHAVNRDMPAEEKPYEFNLHRRANHFAFGHGAHYCIGARLARMEMQSLFSELIKELPLLVIDESRESIRDHYSVSFSGFKELHLRTRL